MSNETEWESKSEEELRALKRKMNDHINDLRDEVLQLSLVIDRKQKERYAEYDRISQDGPDAQSVVVEGEAADASTEAHTP